MEDVPQPSQEPFEPGDTVQVYVDENDPDAEFHGVTGVVVDRSQDDLDSETGRELDAYLYSLEVDGEELRVEFRHFDLVPHSD